MKKYKHIQDFLLSFAICLLFYAVLWMCALLYWERVDQIEQENYRRRATAVADEETKTKMKWHGTDSATCDNGECYFIRQGKKVRM